MSNLKLYTKGVFTSYLSMAITTVIGLFLTRFTLAYVTKDEYGYFTLIADILSWLSLLQFGTSATFGVRAAQIIGKGDYNDLNRYTTTSVYTQLFIAVIITIIGGALSFKLDWIINTNGIDRSVVIHTFLISVLTFGVSLFRQIYSAILIANKQIHIDNILNIGLFVIQAVLTVIFLLLGWSITSLAASYLISTVIITIVNIYRVRNLPYRIEINKRHFSKKILLELFGTGIWFTIGGIAGILILRIDRFFMANYISLAVVTNFYITSKIYDFINRFFQSMVNTTRPYISQMYGQNNISGLRMVYNILLNGSNLVLVFVSCIAYLINPWFIKVWMGSDSYYLGDQINMLIAVNFVLQSAILPNRALLASTLYRFKFQNLTRIFEGILKLVLSLLLVKTYGIAGLLVGSVLACIFGSTIFLNYLSNKLVKAGFKGAMANYASYLLLVLIVFLYSFHNKFWGGVFIVLIYLVILILIRRNWLQKDKNDKFKIIALNVPFLNIILKKYNTYKITKN